MKKLIFYFDFLSPYSYFAWKNHLNYINKNKIEILYRPVLMGKLFTHHNFPGPGEIPAKRSYELKNCFRIAAANDFKFTPPTKFPFNPLAIIRMATLAANDNNVKKQIKVINAIFELVWAEGRVLEDPDLIKLAVQNKGIQEQVLDNSFTRGAKSELKENIQACLEAGIFGVPSFQVNDEFFWGQDSLPLLKEFLAGNDNWDKELYNKLLN